MENLRHWLFLLSLSLCGALCAENRLISRPTGQVYYAALPNAFSNAKNSESSPSPLADNASDDDQLPRASGRSYPVEIVNLSDSSVPSLAADLNANLMSSELINQLENDYKRELTDYQN